MEALQHLGFIQRSRLEVAALPVAPVHDVLAQHVGGGLPVVQQFAAGPESLFLDSQDGVVEALTTSTQSHGCVRIKLIQSGLY